MNVKSKILFLLTVFLTGTVFFVQKADAANGVNAVEIYRQARYKNYNFLNRLSQYNRLIDVPNRFGDTAYCISLRYGDKETAELLAAYGADKTHKCLNRIKTEERKNTKYQQAYKQAGRYPQRPAEPPVVSEGNNYLWWGVGALALGGGIAAASSGGGGGGSGSKHSDVNTGNGGDNTGGNQGGDNTGGNEGGDNTGGNQGGDNTGGNQGGDNTGGNQGGDNTGGNQGGDNTGGNQGGDNTGGNQGGDNTGGNEGGDNTGGNEGGDNTGGNEGGDNTGGNQGGDNTGGNQGGDNTGGNEGGDNTGGNEGGDNTGGNEGGDNTGGNEGGDNTGGNEGGDNTGGSQGGGDNTGGTDDEMSDVSALYFKTAEYNKGNFLAGIKAAEAYSYIYKKDKNGKLVSHQAASDNPLEKVKVGVIDTGVYSHSNLEGKITGAIDANVYNSIGDVRGYANGGNHYYIFKYKGRYYFLDVDVATPNAGLVNFQQDLSESELNSFLDSMYKLSLDEFTVMNGADDGAPGAIENFDANDVNTWWNVVNELSHGTHVSGIIAGNKNGNGMHGVAFENAEIYAGSWDMIQRIDEVVSKMLDDGVEVFNNSWGSEVTTNVNAANAELLYTNDSAKVLSAYAMVANNKGVWVQATGNDQKTEAAVHTGMGKLDLRSYGYNGAGKYEAPLIAVTALDPSTHTDKAPLGQIASYANWCGSAQGYCLAAPGTGVYSTVDVKDGYLYMDGTSMATPVVSGSIALLKGYYPWLSAQNVAWLLLETANDEGAYADSNIYGKGVLDLEAAITTPVEELSLASSESFDSLEAARLSKLSLSGPLQKKLEKIMPEKIIAFDALKRPFAYDTERLVNKTHGSNANFRNKVSRMAAAGVKKTIKDEKTGFSFSSSDYYNKGGKAELAQAEVLNESESGTSRFYYAENSKYLDNGNVMSSSANPYFAMNEAYGAEQVLNLNDTSKLKLMLQTGENGLYERDYEQDRASFDERSYAMGAEYSFKLTDYLELATTGGMLFEEDALLGMNGAGGFNIKDGATYYMGLKAALNLTDKVSLLAAYYRGYTKGSDTAMLSISDLQTESLSAALEYRLNATDKVGLSFGSPLSVVKGRAGLTYATGRDNYSDKVYTERLNSSLKPEAKEYDLGVYYQGQPKEDLNFMGKVEARFNADGEKGVTDYLGIVGVSAAF